MAIIEFILGLLGGIAGLVVGILAGVFGLVVGLLGAVLGLAVAGIVLLVLAVPLVILFLLIF